MNNTFVPRCACLCLLSSVVLLAITLQHERQPKAVSISVISLNPSPSNTQKTLHSATKSFSTAQEVRSSFQQCWSDDDYTRLFNDEWCRLAWHYYLSTSVVIEIGRIEEPPSNTTTQNGAMRMTFDDHFMGWYKSCTIGCAGETWHSELIAFAIDKLLHLWRTPAVIPRKFKYSALSMVKIREKERHRLPKVVSVCGKDDKLLGAMIGWMRYPVKAPDGFDKLYLRNVTYDVTNISNNHLEMSRMLLALIAFGDAKKMDHNIYIQDRTQLKSPTTMSDLFLVTLDNDRARWQRPRLLYGPPQPLCNRRSNVNTFQCSLHDTQTMAQYMEYLETSCVFPASVAERVLLFGSGNSSLKMSDAIQDELHFLSVAMSQPPVHNDQFESNFHTHNSDHIYYHQLGIDRFCHYYGTSANEMLTRLAAALESCLRRYPRNEVIFIDNDYTKRQHTLQHEPYEFHTDPAGHLFKRDPITGVWTIQPKVKKP